MGEFTLYRTFAVIAVLFSLSCRALVIQADANFSNQAVGNLTANPGTHCTTDSSWLVPQQTDLRLYDWTCQRAMWQATAELSKLGAMNMEYEFVDRDAKATTTKPKIQLPRKYTYVDRRHRNPSCTIAIAMIGSPSAGDPLPGQPSGPFGSTDVMNLKNLVYGPGPNLGSPFVGCVRKHRPFWEPEPTNPELGWTQAGNDGNIGVFYVGTRSVMDRRILRAIHPGLVLADS